MRKNNDYSNIEDNELFKYGCGIPQESICKVQQGKEKFERTVHEDKGKGSKLDSLLPDQQTSIFLHDSAPMMAFSDAPGISTQRKGDKLAILH